VARNKSPTTAPVDFLFAIITYLLLCQ